MTRKTLLLIVLAFLVSAWPTAPQGRLPVRSTFDERLKSLEERLAAVEDRLAKAEENQARETDSTPAGLTSRSEAKLDRLEVRVIQLESNAPNCDCNEAGQRFILDRIRSLERQVSRLRSGAIR